MCERTREIEIEVLRDAGGEEEKGGDNEVEVMKASVWSTGVWLGADVDAAVEKMVDWVSSRHGARAGAGDDSVRHRSLASV